MPGDPNALKKYEELYTLSKEGLAEEIERFKRVDDKASRYLSFVTFLLVALGLAAKPVGDFSLQGTSVSFWIIALAAFIFVMSTAGAVWILFSTLRILPLKKPPLTQELVEFFDRYRYLDVIYAMTKRNFQAASENRDRTNLKTNRLTRAYKLILGSITSLGILALTIFLLTLLKTLKLEFR